MNSEMTIQEVLLDIRDERISYLEKELKTTLLLLERINDKFSHLFNCEEGLFCSEDRELNEDIRQYIELMKWWG